MASVLRPRAGVLASPDDIAERLRNAFPYVAVDEAAGMEHARRRADLVERPPPLVPMTPAGARVARAEADRLRTLGPGQALGIAVGDGPGRTLRLVVIEGDETIFVGHASGTDEDATRDIVERCAQALDCDIETI